MQNTPIITPAMAEKARSRRFHGAEWWPVSDMPGWLFCQMRGPAQDMRRVRYGA